MSFTAAVYRLVRSIPHGRVVTYGQVAAFLGHPRRARAVGRAMSACPGDVPWHRVVNARGAISPRRRLSGMLTQRIRLEGEGIRLRHGRVALEQYGWRPRSGRRGESPSRREGSRCVWH